MKKRYLIAVLSVPLLTACASAPESRSPTEVNHGYINTVERNAANAGVQVKWINPPTRKRDSDNQG